MRKEVLILLSNDSKLQTSGSRVAELSNCNRINGFVNWQAVVLFLCRHSRNDLPSLEFIRDRRGNSMSEHNRLFVYDVDSIHILLDLQDVRVILFQKSVTH